MGLQALLAYGVPTAVSLSAYWLWQRWRDRRNSARLTQAQAAGLGEPASLHPLIDPALCKGCGACVAACPEGDILGIISGGAHLIEPTRCIGHGACRTACPYDAITLVFGTEKRGVDIPFVSPDFQTNVPGIYIAGELGGMGLIRNAVTQGVQAMQAIRKSLARHALPLDVVIVGAGPAGLAASLYAKANGLRYRTLEQDTVGGTVAHFPRGKIVMTAPATLPIVGKLSFRETTKEKMMVFWEQACRTAGLEVRERERVEEVRRDGDGFAVRTTQGTHRAARVLLAIGRRGTPRQLGVPGEQLPKVVYRLVDPAQYRGRHVLVVGGGDAALEAAASVADEPGATVTLSHRGTAFDRAKDKNRERIAQLEKAGRLRVLLGSQVEEIRADQVAMKHAQGRLSLRNDAVVVCAGGVLPTPFLKQMGIEVETKHGRA